MSERIMADCYRRRQRRRHLLNSSSKEHARAHYFRLPVITEVIDQTALNNRSLIRHYGGSFRAPSSTPHRRFPRGSNGPPEMHPLQTQPNKISMGIFFVILFSGISTPPLILTYSATLGLYRLDLGSG